MGAVSLSQDESMWGILLSGDICALSWLWIVSEVLGPSACNWSAFSSCHIRAANMAKSTLGMTCVGGTDFFLSGWPFLCLL